MKTRFDLSSDRRLLAEWYGGSTEARARPARESEGVE
jgi:hypothetical protein